MAQQFSLFLHPSPILPVIYPLASPPHTLRFQLVNSFLSPMATPSLNLSLRSWSPARPSPRSTLRSSLPSLLLLSQSKATLNLHRIRSPRHIRSPYRTLLLRQHSISKLIRLKPRRPHPRRPRW